MKVATNATKKCDILYLVKKELWLPQFIFHMITHRRRLNMAFFVIWEIFLCKKMFLWYNSV